MHATIAAQFFEIGMFCIVELPRMLQNKYTARFQEIVFENQVGNFGKLRMVVGRIGKN